MPSLQIWKLKTGEIKCLLQGSSAVCGRIRNYTNILSFSSRFINYKLTIEGCVLVTQLLPLPGWPPAFPLTGMFSSGPTYLNPTHPLMILSPCKFPDNNLSGSISLLNTWYIFFGIIHIAISIWTVNWKTI